MKIISINNFAIPDIKIIRFARFCDQRGYFTESYRKSDFFSNPEMEFMKDGGGAGQSRADPRHARTGRHRRWK